MLVWLMHGLVGCLLLELTRPLEIALLLGAPLSLSLSLSLSLFHLPARSLASLASLVLSALLRVASWVFFLSLVVCGARRN